MDDLFNKARKEAIKMKREAKRTLDLETPLEKNIREATSNENWGCANSILYEIAEAAKDYNDRQKIMKKIREFLEEKPNKWRRILKTLMLVEFLLKNGNERTVDECLGEQYSIRRLEHFSYSEEGKERGSAVRDKAKAISEMLSNKDSLKAARDEARAHREKFSGVSTATAEGGGRPSSRPQDGMFRMEQGMSKSSFDEKFNELKKKKEEDTKQRDVRDVRYDRRSKKEGDQQESRGARSRDDDQDRTPSRPATSSGGGRRRDDEDDFNPSKGRGEDSGRRRGGRSDDDDDFGFDPNGGSGGGGGSANLLDTADTGGSLLMEQDDDDGFNPNAMGAKPAPPPQQASATAGLIDLFDAPAPAPAPAPATSATATPLDVLDLGGSTTVTTSATNDFDFGDFAGSTPSPQLPTLALDGGSFNPNGSAPQSQVAPGALGFAAPMPMQASAFPVAGQPAAMPFPGPMGQSPPVAGMSMPGFSAAPPMGGAPNLMVPPHPQMPQQAAGSPTQEVPKDTFLGDVGGLCDLTLEGSPKDTSKGSGKGNAASGMVGWTPSPAADTKKPNPDALDFGNPFEVAFDASPK